MRARNKRKTPGRAGTRADLPPKATAHDARVDGGRLLKASEILTAPTDPRLMIPKILGWPPTLRWPPDADELLTPAATNTLQTFMWPLTVDELLTLSPAEALEKAEEERRKPKTDKLLAWFGERLLVAYRESKASPDPDTQRRLCREAWTEGWNDVKKAWADAYPRRQRDTHEQTQEAAELSVEVRQTDSNKWREYASRVFARARDGDETLTAIAERIQDELIERGWAPFSEQAAREVAARLDDDMEVPRSLWKDLSRVERRDSEIGYVPELATIVRFLRNPTKNQRQEK